MCTDEIEIEKKRGFIPKARPPVAKRKFCSQSIEIAIKDFARSVSNEDLTVLVANCLANTLDTTVHFTIRGEEPDTFVVTGDIDAMWLRDSTAQVWPYLTFAGSDIKLRALLKGVIHRQVWCILTDPYANAFTRRLTDESPWKSDKTEMRPLVYERKWEVDSLCYAVRLAYRYWKVTGDPTIFNAEWKQAMRSIVTTFRKEQRKCGSSTYTFQRTALAATDTLPIHGRGYPTAPVGLICSSFRPSDDATILPFLIPSNLFAVVSLRQLAEMLGECESQETLSKECCELADEVERAVQRYGIHEHPNFGRIYAYEVDGYGGRIFMDDANVPSLLSLPYLGCCSVKDPVYQATRNFILSAENPWMFQGTAAAGIGSPHTGLDRIWPIGIIMRGLTSISDDEIFDCLQMLARTTAGTGLMHESFDKDDPDLFTRGWFAWANTLFGEWLFKLQSEKLHILKDVCNRF
jgi:meiotically up-regulated gene 157 (Mug157) protein